MIALLLGAALAAVPALEPGKAGKKCDGDEGAVRRAQTVLEDVAKQVRIDPVSSVSFEFKDRIKRAKKASRGYLCTYEDHLNAATVLSVSGNKKDLDKAFQWAAVAANGQVPNARIIATHAFDRALVARGLPQHYGTQFGISNGRARGCMYPVDPTFTDEQRAAWGVQSLEKTVVAYLAEMGHAGQTPNDQTLQRLNLMCISEKW